MKKSSESGYLTKSDGSVIKYREQGDVAFQVLTKSQMMEEPVSLKELMTYSITAVPHSLGTPDGYLNKTNKATLVHHLTDEYTSPRQHFDPDTTAFIEDGNATVHAITQLPPTLGAVCMKVLSSIEKQKKNVVFQTDM